MMPKAISLSFFVLGGIDDLDELHMVRYFEWLMT
jgi:hypothetical protein